jgi:Fe2+ transport system protein FeoA
MKLFEGKCNKNYIILSVGGEDKIKRRFCDLGFYPGAKIKILRVSPLRKTYLISVLNTIIALRKVATSFIEIGEDNA